MNMKKIITSLFILVIMNTANGQGHFDLGSNVIGLGIGFGGSLGSGYSYGTQTPALSLHFDHGMWELGGPGIISIGGYVGYKSYKYDSDIYGYSFSEKRSYTVIGVRSAYHYNGIKSDKFDVYGGLTLAYNIVNYTYSNNDPNYIYSASASDDSSIYLAIYVGGKYYFSDNFAAFAELGSGIAYLNLGVAYKL